MALTYIDQVDLKDKKVLARFDFNVPLKNGVIKDTSRIDLAIPTIQYLLDHKVKKIILMSHLGRPDGVTPELSLEPVANYLAEKLGEEVVLSESAIDGGVKELLTLKKIKIVLLENIRFFKEETKNDPEFCRKLSEYADIYLNDAFGAAHRKHASTYGLNAYFPKKSYAGFLIRKELEALDKIVHNPAKPFVAILGGAKVKDKIKTIEKLLVSVDKLLIGGAMAYPFLKAKGTQIGKSLCDDEDLKLAEKILKMDRGNKITLPIDHIVSSDPSGTPSTSDLNIDANMMGLDIGPKTIDLYQNHITEAKTVFWNGPMGLFENENFAKGSYAIAEAMANSKGFTLVGGGDSVRAINQSGFADKVSHISTGGGASLEYIEQGSLVGINALKFGV